VVLPEYLRTYADLKKEITIAGLYNRLEIWDQHTWSEYTSKTEAARNEIAEQLGELGI